MLQRDMRIRLEAVGSGLGPGSGPWASTRSLRAAFLREARRDLERALRALREADYPEAVFHAQQCAEKAVEAMIEARREYVYNHGPRLASVFARVFEDEWRPEFDEVLDISSAGSPSIILRGVGTRSY